MRTFDNQKFHVPNNKIWGDVITNVTANMTRRVDMVFGIGYSHGVTEDAKRAFDEAHLSIPFPQRDLHIVDSVSLGQTLS